MNTTVKISRFVATTISYISTKVAETSTKASVGGGFEEPKMPKVLLKKAK
ncbi:MAG: cyclic lactone autoinducer peptide [Clostridium sp.]|jgi:cyclic lactone autoinducer peptide